MKRAGYFILLVTLLAGVPDMQAGYAQTSLPPAPYANRQLYDPAQEAQAKALMGSIRCLTCQGQSIADSNVSMAGDMRSAIRERIAHGEPPEHIRRWLIDRYGDWISYDPRLTLVTWPLWGAPFIVLMLGGIISVGRLRRRRTRGEGTGRGDKA